MPLKRLSLTALVVAVLSAAPWLTLAAGNPSSQAITEPVTIIWTDEAFIIKDKHGSQTFPILDEKTAEEKNTSQIPRLPDIRSLGYSPRTRTSNNKEVDVSVMYFAGINHENIELLKGQEVHLWKITVTLTFEGDTNKHVLWKKRNP